MFRHSAVALPFVLAILTLPALPQQSDKEDKAFDVRSSIGDMHVGQDADAQKAGLPLYPGARRKREADNDPLNFSIVTENMGLKLVVAKYESDDPPAKVLAYYREKLKKYGKVLECHSQEGHQVHSEDNDDQHGSKELKCEGDNTGPVTELKAGTEDNQRAVALEPRNDGKTSFVIVYVNRRKHTDI
jgi:hypothetical protein